MAANVQITFTLSEGDTNRLIHALCGNAGVPATAANAKALQIAEWKQTVEAFEQRAAPLPPPIVVT